MKKLTVLICVFLFLGITSQAQFTVSANISAEVSCYGGSNGSITAAPLGGTSPYTYLWSGGQTTATITGLAAGTYTVNATDNMSLTASATATITQPTALTVSASAKFSAVCPGASDSVYTSGSGGLVPYSYSWTGPYGDISCPTCQNTTVYPDGNAYLVTAVNDANGCTASSSISVSVHPFPYVTITGGLSPNPPGHSDTLIASAAGASYLWSNGSTNSSIIVSPSVPTTYSVIASNIYVCIDTAHYSIDTSSYKNGETSSNAIPVVPNATVIPYSYSTLDSVVWFSFVPTDSNNQIIANSAFLGMPVPHVHRLTLYNKTMHTIADEPMPDIIGANQIRIDISHLNIDSTYYVRASRCPAHANMAGCNPTGDVCNASQRWSFQMAFRTVPVFVPDDSGSEPPSVSQLYYEGRGQIADMNDIPRFDIKAYTNNASPSVYASDSALSFVYGSTDTMQRVDMVLTGSQLQPSKPVFKMEEDSGAGFLTYFKEFTYNAVPKLEGYSRLIYKNVYPNIDMQVYSNSAGTKLYFVCNPAGTGGLAGNPAGIELKFKGASSVSVAPNGGLNVVTELGTLSFAPGDAYTDSAGIIKQKSWQPYFVTVNSNTVKFNTGTYNTSEPLIIRMDRGHNTSSSYSSSGNLEWSTYYGGTNSGDFGEFRAVTTDDSGNVYALGYTTSAHFPVDTGGSNYLQGTYAGDTDATVVKFNSAYKRIWACYYGGSGCEIARGIGVYNNGISSIVYFAGSTNSTDLPIATYAENGWQRKLNRTGLGPNTDIFIAGIYCSGLHATQIIQSLYYGGIGNESAHSLTVFESYSPCLYIVGTGDTNTPLVHKTGAYNSTSGGGLILRFNINSSTSAIDTASWATLIGSKNASLNGCAVNPNGYFSVGGSDVGNSYPVKGSYAYPFNGGTADAVITEFKPNDTISWSTYYGGGGKDLINAITADAYGNVYATGHTYSPGTTVISIDEDGHDLCAQGFFQPTNGNTLNDFGNGFVAEFQADAALAWGTYFGGNSDVDGAAICLDANNNIYITGTIATTAASMVWPGTQPAGAYIMSTPPLGSNQTFIAAFNAYCDYYYWGTYLCATHTGTSSGLGITAFGYQQLYVVGSTVGPPYVYEPYGGSSWFQSNYGSAIEMPFISEFNISTITTGENEIKAEKGELKVYPNPTSQNITVEMDLGETGNVEFVLYNLFGELVYSANVNETAGNITKQISLSSLPSGTYILQARTTDKVYYAKITKLQ